MFTRFTMLCALACALFLLSSCPSQADTASDIASLKAAVKSLQTTVTTQQTTITTQAAQIADLQKKTNGISVSTDTTRTDGRKYTEMTFKGLNLHIVNGLGATDGDPDGTGTKHVNGLGNVIIGYNALRSSSNSPDIRTGSHNLVLGDDNNFASYGGCVFGLFNMVSSPYASVSGGLFNTANSPYASVTGGDHNTAKGFASNVGGGEYNTASGSVSGVSGGYGRTASDSYNWAAGDYYQNQ